MATDAERVLAEVRELVRREIHPARQRLGVIGIGNVMREGRLTPQEWMEAWASIDRLLGANTLLIQLLGIDEYVGGRRKDRTG
ncbi:MAG: hypothetical protein L0338_10525 [Acidobacteria bacterium]|nr:hypothetical protein [Acidobacteriota bacterium]